MNYSDELKERIQIIIAEEIQKQDPQIFIQTLSERLSELVMDEIMFKLRR